VADFHGTLTGEMTSHGYLKFLFLKPVFSWIERMINRMGDFAITSSWELEEKIKKFRENGKTEVILDGANVDNFNFEKTKEEIRKESELPEDKLIVGYTGGLVKNKGINFFLDAMVSILEKRKDTFFLIGGYPKEHVEKFMIKNNISKKFVRLVSPLDYFKIPEFLRCMDVAVDPKESDALQASGKMLNYMAAGLPIVCFDKSNNRKYLGDGAFFAKDNSAGGIAQGILFFLDNGAKREERGKANQERVKNYLWNASGKKLEDIYNNLLNKK